MRQRRPGSSSLARRQNRAEAWSSSAGEPLISSSEPDRQRPRPQPVLDPRPRGPVRSNPGMTTPLTCPACRPGRIGRCAGEVVDRRQGSDSHGLFASLRRGPDRARPQRLWDRSLPLRSPALYRSPRHLPPAASPRSRPERRSPGRHPCAEPLPPGTAPRDRKGAEPPGRPGSDGYLPGPRRGVSRG